jgi:signal transduction histidine kinase
MALRGNGSHDRFSSAVPGTASARKAPRRRRFFRRAEPLDLELDYTRIPDAEPEPEPLAVSAAALQPQVEAGPDPYAELLANVALRDLTLIESLLEAVEEAERDEQDPDRLAFLFRLDHLATRLRRSSENLLVLAGRDAPDGPDEPVALLEVVRAAISESADYARVDIGRLPPVAIGPHAADDLSHLLAELLDNALAMSPSHTTVSVSGSGASNTVLIVVEDDGIGIPMQRLAEYNTRLAAPPSLDAAAARQMGLYVVASLAHRHGVYVQMQARPGGGTSVVAALPLNVLAAIPAPRGASLAPGLGQAGPAPWFATDLRTAPPAADAWMPGPAEPEAPATVGGLPRRTRPTGWAEPPPPPTEAPPADPQSIFDDLAAFDAGQRAAADVTAWEGPWEN